MARERDKKGWHDWVEELFEPEFCATIDDLVAHEEDPDNKPRIKHISSHDPEAIRKVLWLCFSHHYLNKWNISFKESKCEICRHESS